MLQFDDTKTLYMTFSKKLMMKIKINQLIKYKFLYKCFYTIRNIFYQRSRISFDPSFEHGVSKIWKLS